MLDKVKELIEEVHLFKATSKTDIETFRIKYLGSKGILKGLFSEFKNVDAELRKEFGQALNTLKKSAEDKVVITPVESAIVAAAVPSAAEIEPVSKSETVVTPACIAA